MSEEIMLTEQQQAEALHKQITGFGEVIYQSLYGMCTAIKQMRDSKLYRALGHSTFEEYAEEKLGMSRSQAYNYITIAEKLTEDFVQPVGQIGMRKLLMLTALTDEQRDEITGTVDLSTVTVKQLQQEIYDLKAKALDDRQDSLKQLQEKQARIGELMDERTAARKKIKELETQVQELESRPVEVAVPEPSHEIQNMQDAMRRINAEQEAYNARVQDEHFKQVQEIHAKHRAETDALRAEYEEKLAAAQSAEAPAPDSKEIFKAYLANAIDAAKRMTAFLAAHPNEPCRAQAEKFFQTMLQEVQA
ncbi:MAG: hypothetical protein IJ060_02600 [Oscillospiraceae bacterium]|nr:hypothetical protein [Oscillospiraceae bacterium]